VLTQDLEQSPKERRGGQISHLLLGQAGNLASDRLTVTWVEGPPDSEQATHAHPNSEQAYVIVRGRGLMKVGNEQQEVSAGTLVVVPPGTPHSVRCIGDELLVYVSAASPSFEVPAGGWTE
jgi:mannose-6-phosphate isomerase-like protein (cupin superfamily)